MEFAPDGAECSLLFCKVQRGMSMRIVNVLSIQRISAADRARIEAVDPAVRLTDAGGWFDGEIRDTWPAYAAARYLAAGRRRRGHARGTRPVAGRGGGDPGRLAVPARSARAGAAAEMVPPAPGGREQPAARRPVGQRRGGDDLARRRATRWRWRNTRSPASCTSPRVSTARWSIGRRARSIIAPTGRCCWRARRSAWSAPAGSAARSAGWPPRWACA